MQELVYYSITEFCALKIIVYLLSGPYKEFLLSISGDEERVRNRQTDGSRDSAAGPTPSHPRRQEDARQGED